MSTSNAQAGPSTLNSRSPAAHAPSYLPLADVISKAIIVPALAKVHTLPDVWAERLDPQFIVNIVAQAESHYQVTIIDAPNNVHSNLWLPKHVVPRDIKKAWQMGKSERDQLKRKTRAHLMTMDEALRQRDEIFRQNLEHIRFMATWADGNAAQGPTQDTNPAAAPTQQQAAPQASSPWPDQSKAGPSPKKPFNVPKSLAQSSPKPVRDPPAQSSPGPFAKRQRTSLAGDTGDESAMLSPANERGAAREAQRNEVAAGPRQTTPTPAPAAKSAAQSPSVPVSASGPAPQPAAKSAPQPPADAAPSAAAQSTPKLPAAQPASKAPEAPAAAPSAAPSAAPADPAAAPATAPSAAPPKEAVVQKPAAPVSAGTSSDSKAQQSRRYIETSPTPMPMDEDEARSAPGPQRAEPIPVSSDDEPRRTGAGGFDPPDTQAFRPFLTAQTGSLLDESGRVAEGAQPRRRRDAQSPNKQPPSTPATQMSSPIRDFTPSQNARQQRSRQPSNSTPRGIGRAPPGSRRSQIPIQQHAQPYYLSQQEPPTQSRPSPPILSFSQPLATQSSTQGEPIDVDAAYGSDDDADNDDAAKTRAEPPVPSTETTMDIIEGRIAFPALAPGTKALETFANSLDDLLQRSKYQQALAFCGSAVSEANSVALAAVVATMAEPEEWEEGSLEPKPEEILRKATEELDIADELMSKALEFLTQMEMLLEGGDEPSVVRWIEPGCPQWLAVRAQPDPRTHTSKLVERLGAEAKKFIATVKLVRQRIEEGEVGKLASMPISSTPATRTGAEAGQRVLQQRILPPSQGIPSQPAASQGSMRGADGRRHARILVEDSDVAAPPSPEEIDSVLENRAYTVAGRAQVLKLVKRSPYIPSFIKPEVERFVLNAMRGGHFGNAALHHESNTTSSSDGPDVSETQEDGFLRTKPHWGFELVRPGHRAESQTQSLEADEPVNIVLLVRPEDGFWEVQPLTEEFVATLRNDPCANPWFDSTGQPFVFYEGPPAPRAGTNSQSGGSHFASESQELEALRAQLAEARKAEAESRGAAERAAEEATFLRGLYNESSDAAVKATKEARLAEAEASKLRRHLHKGLESLRAFAKQPKEQAEKEVERLRVEIRMLKALHAKTGDAGIRRKAALWDAKLARDEDERKMQEAAQRKREKLARKRQEERQRLLGELVGNRKGVPPIGRAEGEAGVPREDTGATEDARAQALAAAAAAAGVDSDDELAALAAEAAAAGDDVSAMAGDGEGRRARRTRGTASAAPTSEPIVVPPSNTSKGVAELDDELMELAAEAADAGVDVEEDEAQAGRRKPRRAAAVAAAAKGFKRQRGATASNAPPPLLSDGEGSSSGGTALNIAQTALQTQVEEVGLQPGTAATTTGELEASLAAQLSAQASAAADVTAGELAHELSHFASSDSVDTVRAGSPGAIAVAVAVTSGGASSATSPRQQQQAVETSSSGATRTSTTSALSGFARRAITAASFMGAGMRRGNLSTDEEQMGSSSDTAFVEASESME